MTKIAVIGAGAWGTALAQVYAEAGHDVTLWSREQHLSDTINHHHENLVYLPGFRLSPNIHATADLAKLGDAEILLNVTPAQYVRDNIRRLKPHINPQSPMVICAKGIEIETRELLSDVVHEECENPCAILTGPSFAHDMVAGLPTAATLACGDSACANGIQSLLTSKTLRLYTTDDLIGAQIGGAIKNVIAIACGIVEGLKLGESARAALVTRGLAEIGRLTVALGGRRETLMGQCGVGDLVLTCSSIGSRNYSFGLALGQGQSVEEILASRKSVTEGVFTAKAAHRLAADLNVEMPIVETIYACIHEGFDVRLAVGEILDRPTKSELA